MPQEIPITFTTINHPKTKTTCHSVMFAQCAAKNYFPTATALNEYNII
jgi:hypothetical protein